MKIPHFSPFIDFKAWLAWRCRILSRRLDPDRPYLMGPFPTAEGKTLLWHAQQGEKSFAVFETEPIGNQQAVPLKPLEERVKALKKAIFGDDPEVTENDHPRRTDR